ncbi:MAG TPA: RNase III inhibitor [Clostridiales bacterium]|nr:RNase III inhibitor [Clostridiales bacterium]
MPLHIIHGDITRVAADAIVNAANTALQCGGGVCGAIFAAAGRDSLQAACDSIGSIKTGEAVITPGFKLPARHVIHTAGPVWRGGDQREGQLLENCYRNSLELARQNRLESIAFPLISAGIYGYPKDQALEVAVRTIRRFLKHQEMNVSLVFFDRASFELPESLLKPIRKYLSEQMIQNLNILFNQESSDHDKYDESEDIMVSSIPILREPSSVSYERSLPDLIAELDEGFSRMLFRLIDQKGRSDVEVYKKANLDRRLFSKIRSDVNYRPAKTTALALSIALELNLDETRDLLGRAGFALSRSSVSDVVIQYYIEHRNYNIFEINEVLFAFNQQTLGS